MAETTRAKKTNLACDSCRRRKRKCDGRTPVCSLCEKSNYECVYDATLDQRRPVQKSYVAALEARVALLESVLRDAGAGDVAGPSGLASIDEGDPTPQVTRAPSPATQPSVNTQPEPGPESAPESEPVFVPSDDAAQALASVALPNPDDTTTTASEEFDLGMDAYLPLVNLDMEHKLLAQFWDWQRMHLPYVAPVPFLSAYALYAQVAHPGEPVPPPPAPPPPNPLAGPSAIGVPSPESVCPTPDLSQFISPFLLDAMFAIASLFHGNLDTSNMFYKRAEGRLLGEAANPRLATIQAVLLMATAELGHARAPASWTLNGVAVALCVRLGMHVDATPLVRRGAMSKTLFETRNFVFWATYNIDRFHAICMGMHPLMDRRIISTPRHSSLAAANVVDSVKPEPDSPIAGSSNALTEKPPVLDVGTTWWSPTTLGMDDVLIQAAWEAIRDLITMTDVLFEGIYAFDTPKRSPQEDLGLVTSNNLTIQRFLDELPTWLRSTGVIRRKESGLVYLQRNALGRHDRRVPAHSLIIRRYRTLAFRVARASALQVSSLIRHIPLSSPCVTLPYVVYTACTILLLAPDDTAAMDGVRTGLACLKGMDESGYWVNSAKDAGERIHALAKRWNVEIGQGKKVLGLVVRGGGGGPGGPDTGGGDGAGSGPKDMGAGDPKSSEGSGGAHLASESGGKTGDAGVVQPSSNTAAQDAKPESGATHDHGYSEATQSYEGATGRMYAGQDYSASFAAPSNHEQTTSLPQDYDKVVAPDAHFVPAPQTHGAQDQNDKSYYQASGLVFTDDSEGGYSYNPQQQSYASAPAQAATQAHGGHTDYSAQTYLGATSYGQEPSSKQQHTQYAPQLQYQSQQPQFHPPTQHHHIHVHQHYHQHQHQHQHQHYHQHYHTPAPSACLPHVAYATSHAEPQHDSHLPHTHWHQILPPADPNLPFPPDPTACADVAACFADTVQTAQDPAFVSSMEDPYAGLAVDWISDAECNFPPVTMDMYESLGAISSSAGMGYSGGVPGIYAQGSGVGQSYGHSYPMYGYNGAGYMSGYESQGM